MAIRKAVEEFLRLGPLPESSTATEQDVDNRYEALKAISPPVTDEESLALAEAFGPDECFGVAGSLVHLIETALRHEREFCNGVSGCEAQARPTTARKLLSIAGAHRLRY